MEFLDNSVLPQSTHHMHLLKYLLVLTNLILYSYIGTLWGSFVLSLYYKRLAKKHNSQKYNEIAKYIIDLVTFNKSVSFGLGIIPMLSSAFCYAQLLHLSGVQTAGFIIIASGFLFVSIIFVYTYKHTFHLSDILGASVNEISGEKNNYLEGAKKLNSSSGLWGMVTLTLSILIYFSASQFASDSGSWSERNNFLGIIFSLDSVISFLQFLLISFIASSTLLLYKIFSVDKKIDDGEFGELKNKLLIVLLISLIIIPALILLLIIVKPANTLSYEFFATSITVFALILLLVISTYKMLKNNLIRNSSNAFFMVIFLLFFIVLKEQYAFDSATKQHFEMLSANYNEFTTNLKKEMGMFTEQISGQDIYNGRCIACHNFDQKIVGPPYNDVLPKYVDKKDDLVKYILNPVKVNPEYPAMPSQGLKPNEAEAVAEYLLTTYKK
ncbi:MAG: cytochrome c [Melioribacteraceae bacterium]|nr:cytochrome c [Melioribacteraceae bacterium]